jgi:hypothetical protein
VETYREIRLALIDGGLPRRAGARRFGIASRTVKNMLNYSAS